MTAPETTAADKRVPFSTLLFPSTLTALDVAAERMGGRSRAFVIEVLTTLYAGSLTEATIAALAESALPPGTRTRKRAKAKRAPKKKAE
jgi:hypothetical protein